MSQSRSQLTLTNLLAAAWVVSLTMLLGCAVARHGHHDATARHSFDDVEYWRKIFDDPKRDAWQKPDDVVAAFQIAPGMRVADLGAGTGYFTSRLARAVGPQGAVFAVEVEPNLVTHLRQRAEAEGLDNVIPILGSLSNPRLPRRGVDLIAIIDTYHHIDDRLSYLRTLRAMLAPGGRVAIVDWREGKLPEGPPPDHKLAHDLVVSEFDQSGYRLIDEPNLLPYQYVLVFEVTP